MIARRINVLTENTSCHFCGKVFCCGTCRDKHELNKHGRLEPKCPLCFNEKVQIKSFDDANLLKHLVKYHFPLCCNLCGQVFREASDLQTFQKCNWKCTSIEENKDHSSREIPSQSLYIPSPVTRHLDYSSGIRRSLSEGLIQTSDHFSSINRFTSTPIPGIAPILKLNNLNKNANDNFHYTMITPRTPQKKLNVDTWSGINILDSGNNESKQNSHTSKIDNKVNNIEVNSTEDNTNWKTCNDDESMINNTNKCNNSNKEEDKTDDKTDSISNDLLETADEISQENHESSKRSSRKSPLNETYSVSKNSTKDSMYFENVHVMSHVKEESTSNVGFHDAKSQVEVPTESSTNDLKVKKSSTEKSTAIEKAEITSEESHDNDNIENEPPNRAKQKVSGESTRMIMMVVVEKSNGTFSSTDLRPILESGLKKLENVAKTSESDNVDKKYIADPPKQKTRSSKDAETIITTMKEVSYMRVTNSDYMSPVKRVKKREGNSESESANQGFISSMTRALMNAFKKIPDKMTSSLRNLSRENPLPALPAPTLAQENGIPISETFANNLITSPRRPHKRRREETEATESSSTQKFDGLSTENDSLYSTPRAKKYRGSWIKIKGRPPIARMRKSTTETQKHISSSTQRFQKGSLSVGSTVIPIPSRAQETKNID